MDTHQDTRGPKSHSRYQDNHSPESVFDWHKIDYGKIEYNKDTIKKHSNECPKIGVSTSSGYILEPASGMRVDNYTMEDLTQTVDIIEVPRFPEHNDEDRKPEGDNIVTP